MPDNIISGRHPNTYQAFSILSEEKTLKLFTYWTIAKHGGKIYNFSQNDTKRRDKFQTNQAVQLCIVGLSALVFVIVLILTIAYLPWKLLSLSHFK